MFTKYSKTHRCRKGFPYYTQEESHFLRQSRERFFIFRYSVCRREKDPPTIRRKNGRFVRVFFEMFTEISKMSSYYTHKKQAF